jgi:hypothetical protein
MEIVQGSHGTCRSFAKQIKSSGKFKFGSGIRGTGAYFWRNSPFYLKLAKSWYEKANHDGQYVRELERNCEILNVKIECPKKEYLNLQDTDVKDRLDLYLHRLGDRVRDNKGIARAYDLFFKEVERDSGAVIKLIRTDVTTPGREYCDSYYNIRLLGNPPCLITRCDAIISKIDVLSEQEVSKL